ncbi:MAG: hypothetical protein LBL26_10050 [Peptococcaceae bacterium]|jgi:hypothetical protein|nr:hypothetical protein [Peptococcaceae bacterium]
MLKQFKYALRETGALRLGTFAGVVAVNAVFFVLASIFSDIGWPRVSAIVFSSLALCAVAGCCVVADISTFRGIFHPDRADYVLLTPAGGAEILSGRVLIMVLADLINLAAGIAGVLLQSLRRVEINWEMFAEDIAADVIVPSLMLILLFYLMLTLALFFARAMRASVFHSVAGGGILASLSGAAAVYVLSFMDFALLPLGSLQRHGTFFVIMLDLGFNWGVAAFLLLSLVKCAVLFVLTARLIERRINL